MNVRQIIPACAVLMLFAAVGCGSDNNAASSSATAAASAGKPASSSASMASAKPSAAPDKPSAPPPGKAELEESKNEKMGYSIMLPKGTTTSSADGNGASYGYDTMVILVSPTAMGNSKPDDLLRGVNVDGAKVEKLTEGDMFYAIVVKDKAPYNLLAGPKGSKFMAQCMGEPGVKDLAKAVCGSIKPLKK